MSAGDAVGLSSADGMGALAPGELGTVRLRGRIRVDSENWKIHFIIITYES